MNACASSYPIYSVSHSSPASEAAYFNQPRFLKYHIGTTALAAISVTV